MPSEPPPPPGEGSPPDPRGGGGPHTMQPGATTGTQAHNTILSAPTMAGRFDGTAAVSTTGLGQRHSIEGNDGDRVGRWEPDLTACARLGPIFGDSRSTNIFTTRSCDVVSECVPGGRSRPERITGHGWWMVGRPGFSLRSGVGGSRWLSRVSGGRDSPGGWWTRGQLAGGPHMNVGG